MKVLKSLTVKRGRIVQDTYLLWFSLGVLEATSDANGLPTLGLTSREGRGTLRASSRDSCRELPGQDPGDPAHPSSAALKYPSQAKCLP